LAIVQSSRCFILRRCSAILPRRRDRWPLNPVSLLDNLNLPDDHRASTIQRFELKMLRYVPLRDRSLGIQQTASPRGTLNNTYFQAMLERGNSFTRTTAGNRVLTYILEVIQQPERARACGIGAKLSADRAPVDPPPVVQLSIFELRNGVQTDVSFSYDASFFIFASLEVAQAVNPSRPHLDKHDFFNPATVLTGTRVCSAAYLDRPNPAMFFIFPDLSVRHEGRYRFCFNLYETTKHLEDYDINQPGGDLSIVSEHSTNPNNSTEDCHWRMDIQSAPFTIYSAKKYPGLAQSTVLSGTVAEQGCRVRIRRDVRLWSGRRRNRSSMEDEGELSPPYELGLPVPPRAIHENDITTTGPIAVYPDILNKEITKSPEVQYQQGLGSSVQLSHSETIFASNKEPSLNRSAGTENNYTPDDALSQESTAEYPLSITNNDIPSQDHDRHSRQKTQEGGRSSLSRNGPMWESLKQDIYRVYITENNTLLETMPRFEQAHGLKAS
jgi:Velvet factor/Clr5 domain